MHRVAKLCLVFVLLFAAYVEAKTQAVEWTPKPVSGAPVNYYQEIRIFGDTVEVMNKYKLLEYLPKFNCDSTLASQREIIIWDHEILFDGNVTRNDFFVETTQSNSSFETHLKCHTFEKGGVVLQRYKAKNIIQFLTDEFYYPFDKYALNISWKVLDYPLVYAVRIYLPPNTIPIEEQKYSSVSGPFLSAAELRQLTGNGSIIIAKFPIVAKQTRPSISTYHENSYQMVFPDLAIPPKDYALPQYSIVNLTATWERPEIVIFIFCISLILMILLAVLFLYKSSYQFPLWEYLEYSTGIWFFQEGINQLLPGTRPLDITVFDLTIMIPLVVLFFYSYRISCRSKN